MTNYYSKELTMVDFLFHKSKSFFIFSIGFFLFLGASAAQAQVGKFELRLVQESVDCATRKVTFSAQIRATNTGNQFILGSANLVFQFSSPALANPVLVSSDNFSGGRYGQLTLNQQSNFLTASIVYQGTAPFTDAPNVTTDWKSIARISFDIPALSNGCYSLTWNTALDFPSTDVLEVIVTGGLASEIPVLANAYVNATACAFASNLPVATLLGDTMIFQGQPANLKINFTGSTPVSVFMNGVLYPNLSVSPFIVSVTPLTTTTYTLDSVTNACGKGTVQGSATVTIQQQQIITGNLDSAIICAGAAVPVSFTNTGTSRGGQHLHGTAVQFVGDQLRQHPHHRHG